MKHDTPSFPPLIPLLPSFLVSVYLLLHSPNQQPHNFYNRELHVTDNLDHPAWMLNSIPTCFTINSKTTEQDFSSIFWNTVEKTSPEKLRSLPILLVCLCREKQKLLPVHKRQCLNISLHALKKGYEAWNPLLIQFWNLCATYVANAIQRCTFHSTKYLFNLQIQSTWI